MNIHNLLYLIPNTRKERAKSLPRNWPRVYLPRCKLIFKLPLQYPTFIQSGFAILDAYKETLHQHFHAAIQVSNSLLSNCKLEFKTLYNRYSSGDGLQRWKSLGSFD